MATVLRISVVRGALVAALYGRDTWLSLSVQHGSFVRFFLVSLAGIFLERLAIRMAVINLNGMEFAVCLWITLFDKQNVKRGHIY